MRLKFIAPLCGLLLLSAMAFADQDTKFIKVDRDLNIPSFLGYVEDEFIIVLKESVVQNLESKALNSDNALAGIQEFETLARNFDVLHERKQFEGRVLSQASSEAENRMARHFKIRFNNGDLETAMNAYARLDAVEHVEPIGIHSLYATPNDPLYDDPPETFPFDQWHYWDTHSIDADLAWDTQTGDATVVVGILDSGTRYFHTDLGGDNSPWGPSNPQTNGNMWINSGEIPGNGIDDDGNGYVDDAVGYDFVSSTSAAGCSCLDQDCGTADNDPDDGNGHGTHVGGTVAAITNNARAVAGIAGGFSDGTTSGVGNGSKIMALRIGWHARCFGVTTGVVRMDFAAEAMNYVANKKAAGVNVAAINCSWGSSNSGGIDAAVTNLIANDVMVVVAAGNSNSTTASYLSSRGDCLDVAATDSNGNGASFTNHGSWVDVAAPGVDVVSTYRNPDDPDPNNNYIAASSGTSMSAPHICGIAALLESCNPALTAAQKTNLIINNTDPYTDSRDLGSGIANAFKALNAASCATCTESVPVADFSGSPTSGDAPLTVNFSDLSSNNPSTWSWNFGDGGTSTAQNPSHQYSAAGTYTVSLTASNCAGSDVETKVDYITVTEPPCTATAPVADFSGSPTSGDAPLTVNFTDLSTNSPDAWSWDFGDGGTSTAQNPSHQYTAAGTYTVSLTASNCAGSDIETKVDYITVNQPPQNTMHVSDIAVTRRIRGPWLNGQANVTVLDQNGNPVANATVSGFFNFPNTNTKSGTTGSNGVAFIEGDRANTSFSDICFEVTNVTHSTNIYDANANVVTRSCESGDVFSTGDPISTVIPNDYALAQNHPNPFNPTTQITFTLPVSSYITLEVFNISGQRVAVLADGMYGSGEQTVSWNASDQPSGVYLYRLMTADFVETRKMLLIK